MSQMDRTQKNIWFDTCPPVRVILVFLRGFIVMRHYELYGAFTVSCLIITPRVSACLWNISLWCVCVSLNVGHIRWAFSPSDHIILCHRHGLTVCFGHKRNIKKSHAVFLRYSVKGEEVIGRRRRISRYQMSIELVVVMVVEWESNGPRNNNNVVRKWFIQTIFFRISTKIELINTFFLMLLNQKISIPWKPSTFDLSPHHWPSSSIVCANRNQLKKALPFWMI